MDITCFGFLVFFSCHMPQQMPVSDYCQVARPIVWSPSWPRDAKEKIDTHNRTWKRLCGASKP